MADRYETLLLASLQYRDVYGLPSSGVTIAMVPSQAIAWELQSKGPKRTISIDRRCTADIETDLRLQVHKMMKCGIS